uniref:NADH-ubiquinone oxidoreductase chain 4 n=1 Tax=Histeridae sp. BMNH 1274739 TaxID=1796508 RepID=A0A140EG49_9COLE|nr:NADH dehydrogenase subunit 4 [Histeridae sp. BMNH 1274739]
MVSILLMVVFMIPLSFIKRGFMFHQFSYFLLSFIFLLDYIIPGYYNSISCFMGKDPLSYMMILLSAWVCCLMLMASMKVKFYSAFPKLFLCVVLFLFLSLYLAFSSLSVLLFYIFFEMSLIPTLLLVLGWGYQPERLQAGVYLLFYTLLGSLPMMVSIFFLYKIGGSLNFDFLVLVDSSLFLVCMNFAFLVKIPMYFVHLWLPKAHVEAPVSGSMILAGIMLKLGGYGLMRFLVVSISVLSSLKYLLMSISLVGGVIVALICLGQSDIKSLVAYSSVSHMGLVLAGLMTLQYWGFLGALIMMIAHGLCSSGLFCLANLSYERLFSRSLYLNKGLINIMPSFAFWWFLLCSSNMAAPPSLNLLGEILLINTLVSFSLFNMLLISLVSFFSAAYSLYLYSYTQHGKVYMGSYSYFLGSIREHLLLFLHWFPLNILLLIG